MARLTVLASGPRGNSAVDSGKHTRILVDYRNTAIDEIARTDASTALLSERAAFVACIKPAFVFCRERVSWPGERRLLLYHKGHPLCIILAVGLGKSGVHWRGCLNNLLRLARAEKPFAFKRRKSGNKEANQPEEGDIARSPFCARL